MRASLAVNFALEARYTTTSQNRAQHCAFLTNPHMSIFMGSAARSDQTRLRDLA